MADDQNNGGAEDRRSRARQFSKKLRSPQARVNVNEPHELVYWTKELGVDAKTLTEAVKKAGTSVEAVRQHLLDKPCMPGS